MAGAHRPTDARPQHDGRGEHGLGTEPRQARVLVDRAILRSRARAALDRLGVAINPDPQLGDLTIAHQQLVEIAKTLVHEPRLLILDEPTRGVDVGTKAEICAPMGELAKAVLAILVICSDLPEVLTVSDRILVMRAGRLAGEIPFAEASEERVLALALAFAALEHADPAHPVAPPRGYADAAAQ